MSRLLTVVTALVLGLGGVLVAAPAHADTLIETNGTEVHLFTPAPGHSTEWTMTVTNVSGSELPLTLTTSQGAGSAFEGEHPLLFTLTDGDGGVIADSVEAAALAQPSLDLGALPAGATRTVIGQATLPGEAGNEYAGATAQISFDFSVMAADPPPGKLPVTGAQITGLVIAAGAVLALGIYLAARKRRNEDEHA